MKDVKKDKIEIDDDYIEDDDRRVIVFVALALLIIIATVIGLLVSHQKNEINKEFPRDFKKYFWKNFQKKYLISRGKNIKKEKILLYFCQFSIIFVVKKANQNNFVCETQKILAKYASFFGKKTEKWFLIL